MPDQRLQADHELGVLIQDVRQFLLRPDERQWTRGRLESG